ncbi:MAG TPA: alpha/beta fold hydrolase [Acidimicrobiia bacterium]|nr:alpha/beta fold hydrolase [Acidimicrobiia bacterium]
MTAHEGRTGTLDWSDAGGGPGRPLVMVHALGANRDLWAQQVPILSSKRRVVLLDLPGHGASLAAPSHYTVAELGLDVLDVATAAGVGEFDLCGISLGALVALWMGINAPDRVQALVVSNTGARVGSEELWAARIEAVEAGGMEAVREAAVDRFFSPDHASANPGMVAEATRVLLSVDPVGYIGCCAALKDADLRESVGVIRSPTLVIGGDRDIATPPGESVWLHDHIPESDLLILESAAHFSNLERPDDWTAEVSGFLEGR